LTVLFIHNVPFWEYEGAIKKKKEKKGGTVFTVEIV